MLNMPLSQIPTLGNVYKSPILNMPKSPDHVPSVMCVSCDAFHLYVCTYVRMCLLTHVGTYALRMYVRNMSLVYCHIPQCTCHESLLHGMSLVMGQMSFVTYPCHMSYCLLCDMQKQLYVNKCITLFSRWPFFAEFKAFLSTIYRISLSKEGILPLER